MLALNYTHDGKQRVVGLDMKYTYVEGSDGLQHPRDTYAFLYNGTDQNREPVCSGAALLHDSDNFCRAKGRKLAFARAVDNFTEVKSHRAAIWQAFLDVVKVK